MVQLPHHEPFKLFLGSNHKLWLHSETFALWRVLILSMVNDWIGSSVHHWFTIAQFAQAPISTVGHCPLKANDERSTQ